MTLLIMSKQELSRVEVLHRVCDGRLAVNSAAKLMALSR